LNEINHLDQNQTVAKNFVATVVKFRKRLKSFNVHGATVVKGEVAIKGIREVVALITLGFVVANTQGKETQREIARSYNVSRWTIARLAS
jgi:hypothetical protein